MVQAHVLTHKEKNVLHSFKIFCFLSIGIMGTTLFEREYEKKIILTGNNDRCDEIFITRI